MPLAQVAQESCLREIPPLIFRMCGHKIRYASEEQAMESAFRINAKYSDTLGCYKCHYCKLWHAGHKPSSGVMLNRKWSLVKPADPNDPDVIYYEAKRLRSLAAEEEKSKKVIARKQRESKTTEWLLGELAVLAKAIKEMPRKESGYLRSEGMILQQELERRKVDIPPEIKVPKKVKATPPNVELVVAN